MKEEGSTYFACAQADLGLGGRFGVLGTAHVVGSGPAPVAGGKRDPVPDEPALLPDENPAFQSPELSMTGVQGSSAPASAVPSSDNALPLAGDVERGTGARLVRRF